MRKLLLVLAGLTAAALSLYSQNVDSLLRADYIRMGANYHCYEAPTEPLVAAPEGFAPFYVSHYGRHGSRYITFDSSHEYVISHLKQLRDAGLLNEWGDELLSSLSFCWSQMEPRLGRLAPKGVQEHEGIAARMYTRFPEVFGPGAAVRAVSSTSRRCKASMTAFLGSLLRYESSLDLSTDASQENMAYISNHGKMPHKQAVRDLLDSLQNATLCPLDVIAPLVTDSKAAMALLRHPVRFERALYDCVAIDQCLPFSAGLLSFIPYEEGCKLWSLKNKQQYSPRGRSPFRPRQRPGRPGVPDRRRGLRRAPLCLADRPLAELQAYVYGFQPAADILPQCRRRRAGAGAAERTGCGRAGPGQGAVLPLDGP